jgi:hypothetical protein
MIQTILLNGVTFQANYEIEIPTNGSLIPCVSYLAISVPDKSIKKCDLPDSFQIHSSIEDLLNRQLAQSW